MSQIDHKNNIRFYRNLNELSMPQFAAILGKTPRVMHLIEKGVQSPSIDLCWKIADFFNLELAELFFREGHEPEKRIVYCKGSEKV